LKAIAPYGLREGLLRIRDHESGARLTRRGKRSASSRRGGFSLRLRHEAQANRHEAMESETALSLRPGARLGQDGS